MTNTTSIIDTVIEWREPKHARRVYTRPTRSALKLLRHFLRIVKKTGSTGFRRSIEKLADETGLTKASVRRGADCLRQLGYVGWNRGFGSAGFGIPNEYVINLKALEDAGAVRINRYDP
jgi:hypothetical protein